MTADDQADSGGVVLAGVLKPVARRGPRPAAPVSPPAAATAAPVSPPAAATAPPAAAAVVPVAADAASAVQAEATLPPAGQPAAATAGPEAGQEDAAPAARPAARGPRPRRYQPRKASRKAPEWVSVHLYLPSRIMDELDRRAGGEESKPRVLFDALVATRDRLPALIAARHAAMQPEKTGPFVYPQPRKAGPVKAETSIRMRPDNKEAIDDIVWETRASDRTELIEVALDDYFEATGWQAAPSYVPVPDGSFSSAGHAG